MQDTISVATGQRETLVDITDEVRRNIPSGFSGMAYLYVPHTTAAVTINEGADPAVKDDILRYLTELIPQNAGFKHREGNSDAHLKSSLVGNSISLIVENGKLILGTWQAVFFCEFDGPRNRKINLNLMEQ